MKPGAIIAKKYCLLRRIGEGAAGDVWNALNQWTEREVAIKIIARASPDQRERALREARACGRVSHRNVVEILDAGETDGGDPFLVMQLLSGETLLERLRRVKRLHPVVAATIALDAARGLGAAHAAGIIHRDLKPSNIFLHQEKDTGVEIVKLLDFGVSKMLWGDGPPQTRTGDLIGSPAYMSPEQARSEKALTHRTDLWSLGVILFEMLVGDRPFRSRNINVITEIVRDPIPTVASFLPAIDPRLNTAVARCMERDVEQRIGTTEELIALLLPCVPADQVTTSSDGWRKVTRPPSSKQMTAPMPASKVPLSEDQIATVAQRSPMSPSPTSVPQVAHPAGHPAAQPKGTFRPVPATLLDPSRPWVSPAQPPGPSRIEPQNSAAPSNYRAAIDTQDDSDLAATALMPPQQTSTGMHQVTKTPSVNIRQSQWNGAPATPSYPGPPSPAAMPPRSSKKPQNLPVVIGIVSAAALIVVVLVVLGIQRFWPGEPSPPVQGAATAAPQ